MICFAFSSLKATGFFSKAAGIFMTMSKSFLFLPLLGLLSAPFSLLAATVHGHWLQLSFSPSKSPWSNRSSPRPSLLLQAVRPSLQRVLSSLLGRLSLSPATGHGDFLLVLPAAVGLFRPSPPQLTVPSSLSKLPQNSCSCCL
ncbi:hypothetical protein ACOSQ3_013566 [Xanthoceras sorbifolium]